MRDHNELTTPLTPESLQSLLAFGDDLLAGLEGLNRPQPPKDIFTNPKDFELFMGVTSSLPPELQAGFVNSVLGDLDQEAMMRLAGMALQDASSRLEALEADKENLLMLTKVQEKYLVDMEELNSDNEQVILVLTQERDALSLELQHLKDALRALAGDFDAPVVPQDNLDELHELALVMNMSFEEIQHQISIVDDIWGPLDATLRGELVRVKCDDEEIDTKFGVILGVDAEGDCWYMGEADRDFGHLPGVSPEGQDNDVVLTLLGDKHPEFC